MTLNDDAPEGQEGEVLPPLDEALEDPSLRQTFLALVSNYTDRPDLLIAEIEKHDPGFVKRMNEASEEHAKEERESRFKFGRFQAYAGVGLSVVAAIAVLGILGLAVFKGTGFWVIVGLALFYAVTQGGSVGFSRLIDAVSHLVSRKQNGEKPEADK